MIQDQTSKNRAETDSSAGFPAPEPGRNALYYLSIALGVTLLTVLGEYLFRHFILFYFPVIGDLRVNDMISLLLCYTLLMGGVMALKRVRFGQTAAGVFQSLKYLATTRSGTVWVLALAVILKVLGLIDDAFLAKYTLPMWLSPYRNPAIWLGAAAPWLYAISLLAVNGLFVPVAEEFLWRGIVQPHFAKVMRPALSIGVTAVLFSLKHVLVDASFGRFLAIIAFGAICGALAQRKGWKTSAALHMTINTLYSIIGLIMG